MQKWLMILIFIAAAARILWDVRRWSGRGNGGTGTAVILAVILGLVLLFLALRCL